MMRSPWSSISASWIVYSKYITIRWSVLSIEPPAHEWRYWSFSSVLGSQLVPSLAVSPPDSCSDPGNDLQYSLQRSFPDCISLLSFFEPSRSLWVRIISILASHWSFRVYATCLRWPTNYLLKMYVSLHFDHKIAGLPPIAFYSVLSINFFHSCGHSCPVQGQCRSWDRQLPRLWSASCMSCVFLSNSLVGVLVFEDAHFLL